MKNKYHNELKILNYITSTERYKVIFWVSIILCLYGGFILGGASSESNFFGSLLIPFQFPIFNVFLFTVMFLNNINVCSIFKKDFSAYILRLKNKREYIKTLIRLSTFMFLYHFLIILLFIIMTLLLTKVGDLKVYSYHTYEVNNVFYLLFYIARYIIYALLITVISTLIFINTNSKITLVTNTIFLLLMFYLGNAVRVQETFSFSIWSYFYFTLYVSFTTELASSFLMLLILEVITYVFYLFTLKNKRIEIS